MQIQHNLSDYSHAFGVSSDTIMYSREYVIIENEALRIFFLFSFSLDCRSFS